MSIWKKRTRLAFEGAKRASGILCREEGFLEEHSSATRREKANLPVQKTKAQQLLKTPAGFKKKQAISRILYPDGAGLPVIYLGRGLLPGSIRLPTGSGVPPSNAGLHGVSPHRVYLISLQPNCTSFLLHWSSPYGGRALPAMLHCGVRTFLPGENPGRQAGLLSLQRYGYC